MAKIVKQPEAVSLPFMDHIAKVVQSGGCVVTGMGVTPERYRLLLQNATDQDYQVWGPKNSRDAHLIAQKMSGEDLKPHSITVFNMEIDMYLIINDKIEDKGTSRN